MEEDYKEILSRLDSEEKDHAELKRRVAELKEQAAEAMLVAQQVKNDADNVAAELKAQLMALETKLEPLIEVAPVMEDFAATGRVGYLIGKWIIGTAGFVAAAAGLYYSIVHGFRK